jgi:hypothetical protein
MGKPLTRSTKKLIANSLGSFGLVLPPTDSPRMTAEITVVDMKHTTIRALAARPRISAT